MVYTGVVLIVAYIPFDNLSPMQRVHLQHVVEGRTVHDLGAGDLTYAHDLTIIGASHVVAIDKEPVSNPFAEVTFQHKRFVDVQDDIDIAFISWPANYVNHIEVPASRARTIVYVGKNTDGTACGPAALFDTMLHRKLIAYIPERRNTLIICEGVLARPRPATGEEYAALNDHKLWSFDEVEALRAGVV